MRRVGMFVVAVTAAATPFATGCRQTPAVASAPIPATVFGDTTMYSAQLLAFDKINDELKVNVPTSSYVVVLAVVPGKSIEQISPKPGQAYANRVSGSVSFHLQPESIGSDFEPDGMNAADVAEINRCVASKTAAANQRAKAQRKPIVRDSTGRIISGDRSPPASNISGVDFERACKAQTERNTRNRPVIHKFTPREPAERYLVVLASPHALSGPLINERLETLVTSAPDVATTIEAIAQGLYTGYAGTWSGRYVSW